MLELSGVYGLKTTLRPQSAVLEAGVAISPASLVQSEAKMDASNPLLAPILKAMKIVNDDIDWNMRHQAGAETPEAGDARASFLQFGLTSNKAFQPFKSLDQANAAQIKLKQDQDSWKDKDQMLKTQLETFRAEVESDLEAAHR